MAVLAPSGLKSRVADGVAVARYRGVTSHYEKSKQQNNRQHSA